MAVCLAAGLDGIEKGLTPPEETTENIFAMDAATRAAKGIESLPGTLHEAVKCLKEDGVICEALGEHVLGQYVEGKEKEWDAYRTHVSSWEIDRYLVMY
jgi:glutamine synthetase